ncbi:hypothetical protein [Microbispora hainanensis]|uniref:Uncharacterized protein n=1 Tax=Microbispora hainanensis TaxID=568844 RepID=A0A544Y1F7_9ACTN|nr:hypothetical protein [Microbispora hainanensis]TQS10534.1 hypothetical protein FLX08_38170 [Microbispora hainanensis]
MPTGKNRRSWAWFAVAASASLVPWALLATTESDRWSQPPLPVKSIAVSIAGASARDLIVLDVIVIGLLPLLVGVAAVTRSRALVRVACGISGVLALLHLQRFLVELPMTRLPADTPADLVAGSQPDFYLGGSPYGGCWLPSPTR